jgi:hypothetical protein
VSEAEPSVGPDERVAEREGGRTDREVHEEDPVPAQRLREQPPGKEADGASGDGHEDVGAHGPGALGRLGKLGDDDGQDHRGLGGGADALKEAGTHQRFRTGCDPAQDRCDREGDKAGEEHALSTDEVADPAREQEQAAEGDEEGVDDPGQVALAEVKVPLDRGQGDVHDRDVEDDHQLRQADDSERGPAAAIGGRAEYRG